MSALAAVHNAWVPRRPLRFFMRQQPMQERPSSIDAEDVLEVLASRRREMAGVLPGRARDAARTATSALSSVWHDPAVHERHSLARLEMLMPKVPLEGLMRSDGPPDRSYLPTRVRAPHTPGHLF